MSRNPPLVALRGDEFRIMCPACSVMWSTLTLRKRVSRLRARGHVADCPTDATVRRVMSRRRYAVALGRPYLAGDRAGDAGRLVDRLDTRMALRAG